jgi:N-acyl-D-amino-acid deacylase
MRSMSVSIFCVFLGLLLETSGSMGDEKNKSETNQKNQLVETGKSLRKLTSFDDLMRSFMTENELPGASLAIAKDGRLVYARGFGYADVEKQEPVQPDSLFRIASISKPVTSVTIFRLIEQGKLSLDDRVFDILEYEPHLPHGGKIDPRLKTITIRQLLQHTGGWDRDVSIDAMFYPAEIAYSLGIRPPAMQEDIIRFMLGWKLDFDPGTQYAYSNFGYCLLGRVIEKLTGEKYDAHVRSKMLAPLKIQSMKLGRTLLKYRAEKEVRYYTRKNRTAPAVVGDDLMTKVPRQYGAWNLEAMDSHGSWIASAIDLVRFASAVENAEHSKFLSKASLSDMFAPPPGKVSLDENGDRKDFYYGCGWSVRPKGDDGKFNCWHTGSLDGTSTILVIRHDGLCWAVLFNSRETAAGKVPSREIDPLVNKVANAITAWPRHDLFSQFP